MIINNSNSYETLYNQIENLKYANSNSTSYILDFCQSCISDSKLEFLPDSVEVHNGMVIFNYEENNSDHLMISFTDKCYTFEESSIDYFSFQDNNIKSTKNLNWNNVVDKINRWARRESEMN